MDNTITMLEELLEKYKRNSKLSKVDAQIAIELITNTGLKDKKIEEMIPFLATLPQEVCSNSIIEILNQKDESNKAKIISLIISSEDFNKFHGFMRQLDLAKNLLNAYPSFSMYVIMNLSQKVTESGNKPAPTKLANKFVEEFVADSSIYLFRLDEEISEIQFSSFSLFVVGGLIGSKINSTVITEVLSWLKKVNQKISISKQIKRKIESDIKLWDIELKNQLFHLGFVTTVVDAYIYPSEVKTTYLSDNKDDIKEKSDDKPFTPANQNLNVNNIPSSKKLFEKVKHYVSELEVVLEKTNQDNSYLHTKVYKYVINIKSLEKKLEDTQAILTKIQEERKNLINENQKYKDKIIELEELIYAKDEAFEKNKNQLIDMSEVESQYLVEEFKNKLKKKLRIEYMDFKEVEYEEMTIPLGENMRVQMRSLFSILEKEGISFNGGSK